MHLIKYVLRRIIISIPIVLGVAVIMFFLSRAVPGDPVLRRMPKIWTWETYLNEKARMGLDKPLIVQLIIYIGDLFTGNWGYSVSVVPYSKVSTIIWQRLPRTIEIMFISMIISGYIGIKLGKSAAKNRNNIKDSIIRIFFYIFMAIPGYLFGIFILQYFLVTDIKIFPLWGYKTIGIGNPPKITGFRIIDSILSGELYILLDYLNHLFLPILVTSVVQIVIITRQMRSSLIGVLNEDYIRTAYAKGLSKRKVVNKHAVKNSLIPTISTFSMAFPTIFSANIPIEVVFNLNGLGQTFYQCLFYNDYSILTTISFLTAIIVVGFNLFADILIAIIDPRIRNK